jgi:hypothetical protein
LLLTPPPAALVPSPKGATIDGLEIKRENLILTGRDLARNHRERPWRRSSDRLMIALVSMRNGVLRLPRSMELKFNFTFKETFVCPYMNRWEAHRLSFGPKIIIMGQPVLDQSLQYLILHAYT